MATKSFSGVKEISQGQIEWSDSMLYPVLHRLEKEKLIESKWMQSDEGRHRKYYAITAAGKEALHAEKEHWMSMNLVMHNLWLLNPSTGKG